MSEKNSRRPEEQGITERRKRGQEFEDKHKVFLEKLKHMPRTTREEKEERWNCFKEYPLRDDFYLDLMNAYWPEAYKKLLSRLNRPEQVNSEDLDMASHKHKRKDWEIDPVVFAESVKKAISGYGGENQKGISYNFVSCAGTIYRQEADRAGAENDLKNFGVSDSELPRKNMPDILRFVRNVKELWERNPEMASREDAVEQILKEGRYSCTKRDVELVRKLVFHGSLSVSLEQPAAEDGDSTLEDYLADERDDFRQLLEDDDRKMPFLENFFQKIVAGWNVLESAKGKKEQETIKMFFTRDVLKVLKLDNSGKPYEHEPAGDEEFYFSLEPYGSVLYDRIFYARYLCRAFIEKPEDFYETYARLLRKDFDFSDKILTELTGKDKSTISRRRKGYLSAMEGIYSYYAAREQQ